MARLVLFADFLEASAVAPALTLTVKIARHSRMELVVKDSNLWLAALFLLVSLISVNWALKDGNKGILVTAGIFLLFALLLAQKSTFVFDAGQRTVHWKRMRFLRVSTGSVLFDEITDVVTETSLSDGTPSYRLAIVTPTASIPLSESYASNRRRYEEVRETILEFLKPGSRPQPTATDVASRDLESSVRALLRQGRKIDAVILVRSLANVDLAEAKLRVEAIARKMKTAG